MFLLKYELFFPRIEWRFLELVIQGGIDENEDPKVAALRELKEETGVSSAEVLAEVWLFTYYKFDCQTGLLEKRKQKCFDRL